MEAMRLTFIIDGCEKLRFGHGYCNTHYLRVRRHGDPHTVLRTPGKDFDEAAYQRSYRADHVAEHNAANRADQGRYTAWIQSIKLASGCVDCGYRDGPARLHFDHRDDEVKLFNIAKLHGRTNTLAEIAKCDVRCTNCHAQRHGTKRRAVR